MPVRYKVLHTQVGPYPEGRVISDTELKERKADINHLLRAKSIAPTNEPLTETPLEETAPLIELPPESITNEFSSGAEGEPETITGTPTGEVISTNDEEPPAMVKPSTQVVVPAPARVAGTREVPPAKNMQIAPDKPETSTDDKDGPVVIGEEESARPPKGNKAPK